MSEEKEFKEICPVFSECPFNPDKNKLCYWTLNINVQNHRTQVVARGANDGCLNNISPSILFSKFKFIKSCLADGYVNTEIYPKLN